jgi:hypothetical protein
MRYDAAVPDAVLLKAWNGSAWIVTGNQRARTYTNSTTQLTFLVNNDTNAVNWLVQFGGRNYTLTPDCSALLDAAGNVLYLTTDIQVPTDVSNHF